MDSLELVNGSCEAVWSKDSNGWRIYPSEDNNLLHEEIYEWLRGRGLVFGPILRTQKPNYIFARAQGSVKDL